LLDVEWQLGRSGKVTPVAIFEPIEIEGARITKATLHNAGFRGGIIPQVTGKL
jgi:DNA ligase (NAD+)